jgi:acetolactate synthase I/II/III large subunit
MAQTTSDLLWATLRALGGECVFGLPGSQTVGLFHALGQSRLRTIVPTSELAASFMANGYARACGRPGLLVTIPGPGFTYALSGLTEARLDSVPLLYIVPGPPEGDREFQLQALDQRAIAAPIVKQTIRLADPGTVARSVTAAYRACLAGEPGPVMLEVAPAVLGLEAASDEAPASPEPAATADDLAALTRMVDRAGRILLYAGAGTIDAAADLRSLVDRLGAAVVTTTTARGVLPEDHPAVIVRDPGVGDPAVVNAVAARADLVLALGCKFSHNGAAGFALRLPADRLVTVNTAGPSRNYPACLHLTADAGQVIAHLLARGADRTASAGWDAGELARWREDAGRPGPRALPEQVGESGTPVADLVRGLARALPADAIVTTDSGLHQMVIRRHFRVRSPRGLLVPADFQSMGFSLPAAIGAALAAPARRVVAVVGDGGMLMQALELATAVREGVQLDVVVFNDAAYGLIRQSQFADYGTAHGTDLEDRDFEGLAAALGAGYALSGPGGPGALLADPAGEADAVRLIEVRLRDAAGMTRVRAQGAARRLARRVLPKRRRAAIARWLRR